MVVVPLFLLAGYPMLRPPAAAAEGADGDK
jgi:hypothetical protein